jgi:hypothetical protein
LSTAEEVCRPLLGRHRKVLAARIDMLMSLYAGCKCDCLSDQLYGAIRSTWWTFGTRTTNPDGIKVGNKDLLRNIYLIPLVR